MAVATATFTGFRPEAIQFLADLAANNERAWFQPRKAEYERLLKEPLEALCVALDEQFRRATSRSAPTRAVAVPDLPRRPLLEGQVAVQDARRGELRLGRRRPSDAAQGRSHSENVHASGGYFHLSARRDLRRRRGLAPGDSLADGVPPAARRRPRRASGRSSRRRRSRRRSAPSATTASRSSACRPGYPADHPAADVLRLKNVTFGRRLADTEAPVPRLPVVIAESFETGRPVGGTSPRSADPQSSGFRYVVSRLTGRTRRPRRRGARRTGSGVDAERGLGHTAGPQQREARRDQRAGEAPAAPRPTGADVLCVATKAAHALVLGRVDEAPDLARDLVAVPGDAPERRIRWSPDPSGSPGSRARWVRVNPQWSRKASMAASKIWRRCSGLTSRISSPSGSGASGRSSTLGRTIE